MHKNASVFKKYLKYLYLSFSHLSIYLSKKYCFIMFMGYRKFILNQFNKIENINFRRLRRQTKRYR